MIRKWLPLIALILVCAGCGSSVPVATNHSWETQNKMQAARHWEILAADLAVKIETFLAERDELNWRPVYVTLKGNTPFDEIFHGLLISQLMERGLAVSQKKEQSLILEYNTQILEHHHREAVKFPMKYTALAAGVAVARDFDLNRMLGFAVPTAVLTDVAMSHYAGDPSRNEVIITTTLSLNESLCFHQSDIYYINDPDVGHYTLEEKNSMSGRSYNVVN